MSFGELLGSLDARVFERLSGGESIAYRTSALRMTSIRGIFDAVYQPLGGGELQVMSSGPAVFVRLEDLPTDPREDRGARVIVDGTHYQIREVQPDGRGGALLLLHEVR